MNTNIDTKATVLSDEEETTDKRGTIAENDLRWIKNNISANSQSEICAVFNVQRVEDLSLIQGMEFVHVMGNIVRWVGKKCSEAAISLKLQSESSS